MSAAKPLPRYCNTAIYCDQDVRCAVCQQVDALADALIRAEMWIDAVDAYGKEAVLGQLRAALRLAGRFP